MWPWPPGSLLSSECSGRCAGCSSGPIKPGKNKPSEKSRCRHRQGILCCAVTGSESTEVIKGLDLLSREKPEKSGTFKEKLREIFQAALRAADPQPTRKDMVIEGLAPTC